VARRLMLTFLAATSLVMLGFLVPLWIMIGNLVDAQAQQAAVRSVQPLVVQLPLVATQRLPAVVDARNTDGRTTVFLAEGTVLGTPAPAGPEVTLAQRGSFFQDTAEGQVLYAPIADMPGGTAVIRYVTPEDDINGPILRARLVLVTLGLLLLAVAAFVMWRLARSVLRPVEALAHTAESLGSGDLSARVEPAGPPEIQEIGTLLNRLADHIQVLLQLEREGVADVAHRLRTPVTALRLNAEALTDPEERVRLSRDVDRMEMMVDDVIHEARRPIDVGAATACDAVDIVRSRTAFWRVLAEDQGRVMTVEWDLASIAVSSDADAVADALDALIGNVFAYTPDEAPFSVTVHSRAEGGAIVAVSDGGAGFDPAIVTRGSSGSGSTGLGLDIARRTAERSGGSLLISQSTLLGGACVSLVLGGASPQSVIAVKRGKDRQPRRGTTAKGT